MQNVFKKILNLFHNNMYRNFMKLFFVLICSIVFTHPSFGQSPEISSNYKSAETAKMTFISFESFKNTYGKNAASWFDYYKIVEQSRLLSNPEKDKIKHQIFDESSQYIDGTWQNEFFKYLGSEHRDSSSLFNALKLSEDNFNLFPYVVQYAVIKGNLLLAEEYSKKYSNVVRISPAEMEYSYNTLMSADSFSTIYSKGLLDILNLSVLKYVYNIRKDVELKFFTGIIKNGERNYLALSLGKEEILKYNNGYYSGLLISTQKPNRGFNPSVFKTNYIESTSLLPESLLPVYMNYFPSFLLYYREMVRQKNAEEVNKWKNIIIKLATLTKMVTEINIILQSPEYH